MRVLSSMQAGILQKPFSHFGKHYFCVSLLWPFNLETGEPVLEVEMWQALGELLGEGRIFDQSMPKERGEFLCAARFHAPQGTPVRESGVSVRVGEHVKTLLVTGPRNWRGGIATKPELITSMPIRYDNAFGGQGFQDNPIGIGYVGSDGASNEPTPLPCIEYPDQAISSPSATPAPASLEGMDMGWQPRQRFAGTYDDNYLRTRMPGLPDDVDWRLFNDAASDQWINGFFAGQEDYELVNMHPEKPRIRGRLPGVLGRVFLERRVDSRDRSSPLEFLEVPLRLDTVWFLPDREIGVIIHRGVTEVSEDDGTDVINLLAAHESMRDPRRPVDHYREEMAKRSDSDEGYRYMLDTRPLLPTGCPCALQEMQATNEIGMENLSAANLHAFGDNQEAKARAQADEALDSAQTALVKDRDQVSTEAEQIDQRIVASRADVSAGAGGEKRRGELDSIVERIAPGVADGGAVDLTRVDFSAFDELREYGERIANEEHEKASDALREQLNELRASDEPGAEERSRALERAEAALVGDEQPQPLPRAHDDVSVTRIREEIDALDQYQKDLHEVGVSPEQITSALPDMEEMTVAFKEAESAFAEGYRDGAHYLDECCSPHPGEELERRDRLVETVSRGESAAGGDFAFVDLSGMTLHDADLRDALMEYVNLAGATVIGGRMAGVILAKSTLVGARIEGADFRNANLGSTDVSDCTFVGCDFSEARFGRGSIAGTRFEDCHFAGRMEMFIEARFQGVEFHNCTVSEAIFFDLELTGSSFHGSTLTDVNFIQCDLAHTDFRDATLTSVNFITARMPGARFDRALMRNARFIDNPVLNDCSFRETDLQGSNLRMADLAGTDFSRANLSGADLSEANLSGARMDRSRAIGTQFQKAVLDQATFFRADLREASLMKARMLRTRFDAGNLYSVSFLGATLGETGFPNTNLDNTILRDWRPGGE